MKSIRLTWTDFLDTDPIRLMRHQWYFRFCCLCGNPFALAGHPMRYCSDECKAIAAETRESYRRRARRERERE